MDFIEFDEPVVVREDAAQTQTHQPTPSDFEELADSMESSDGYSTPFMRPDESEGKTSFDFIEFDKSVQVKTKQGSGLLLCPSCGAANTSESEFCYECQGELITFRQVEIESKPVKVVLKFAGQKKYKICEICGAHNEPDSDFCRDCASRLNS